MHVASRKVDPEEFRWLVQFIENAEAAGVLWRVGKDSRGNYVISFIAGSQTFVSPPRPRLDTAVRSALDELLKAAKSAGVG